MSNEFINADFRVVRNIPLSDTSGELVFNSDFPYDNISAAVIDPLAGPTLNIALEYDFEQYPPKNLDQGITFFALVPDTANTVEYSNYDGITSTNYLLTTDNTQYPILITDDYLRWAVPPSTLNPYSIYKAYGSYRDKKNNQFIVFGEGGIGASGQQYSNFITSTNGLSWSNLRYNNPYLDIINSFSVDKTSDLGVAVGSGSTYSISILAGNTANGEIWLPIQGSRQLISDPKGIIRGSSWIVYGDPGASGSYSIVESEDGLVWNGIFGVTGSITTADINQFTGTVLAATNTAPSRIFKRDPVTYAWTSFEVYTTLENLVSVDSITNAAVGSEYGTIGSTGTWLLKGLDTYGAISVWFSTDDGQNWTYDDNGSLRTSLTNANLTNVFTGTDSDSTFQGWQFFGSDSNDQLNIIEYSVTGTTGQLASYSYGIIPLEGLTGLNVNSYCTINSKSLDGITYQSFDISGTYETLSTVSNPVAIPVSDLLGIISLGSSGAYYAGTTFANIVGSTALSSFSLEFICDKFTSKSINFSDELGSSGYYYNFIINDYENDLGAYGGSIYNFQTNSYLQGGTGFYTTIVVNDGLKYSENIIFGDMYQFQLTELNKILNEIQRVSNIFSSTTELEKEFFVGNYDYEGISGSQEITKFYKPILNRRQNNIGTYNFDSFTKLEKLVGYPIKQGLLNLQDLYSQISDPLKAEEFQEIIEKLRLLEYHLSYDETILNTIKTELQQITFLQVLLQFFNLISSSLTTRSQNALQNLNVSTDNSRTPRHNELTYDENTLFKFTFDGTNLNFYKDSELLQTFVIYNKKKLNISLNISENIRTTPETTDGLSVGINTILLFENTNSELKQAINDNFEFKTSETDYVSQMKYIGLVPNSDKNSEGLSGIANFPGMSTYIGSPQGFINAMTSFIYQNDEQIIPKNYYYSLSKFINEPTLLRRIAKLMSENLSTSPTFDYYDITTAKTGIAGLPAATGLATYRKIFSRDPQTGKFFLNYSLTPMFSGIIGNIGNYVFGSIYVLNTVRMLQNIPILQAAIEAWRTRLNYEQSLSNAETLSGSYLDYRIPIDYFRSELVNGGYSYNLVGHYSDLKSNPTSSTGPFNRLPNRKFVFDYLYKDLDGRINYSNGVPGLLTVYGIQYASTPGNSILYNQFNNDFKCTTGNIQLLLSDSVTGPTGVSLMSFINKAYQIADVLDGLTANNKNLSFNIAKTVYPSFFSEVLESAGVTSIESKMLEQNKSDFNLLKKYLDRILINTSSDGSTATSFLLPSYDESIVGATGLTNINNQFLALMNDARMYGCSAISDISAYNTILAGYTGITFTRSTTTTQLYNSLIGDYNNTFVPLIKTVLLNQFELDPTNAEYYFSNEQHRLFNRYLNGPTGGETSGTFYNLMSNTGITYNVRNNIYINVNQIYNIFAQETLNDLSNKVEEVFSGSHNIDDDLQLVQNIVYGTNPILEKYTITIKNLNDQAEVYTNKINDFNNWINSFNLLNGVSGSYARFKQMKSDILSREPDPPIANVDQNKDFIMNIPPFDQYYWVAAATGNTANNLSFPEYNPNYRYYVGDFVSFDNYGTTGHSLYQCYTTERYGNIKGVSPGTLGITGTLSSLLCWEEYHDIPEYDQNFPPGIKGKYDEFNFNEMNYSLIGPTGQETPFFTGLYDSTKEYFKGDIVIHNNAPFKCLGSERLFTGVGQGIPPGFNDDYDIYWKVIGSAGVELFVYPESNGVWKLEPELNQDFVDFTTLYGLTATFTTKNSQNKFVVPDTYNSNFSYDFGDLVLFTDNKIYTCLGTNIVGINPPTLSSVAGDALWKAYPYLDTTGIPEFSITRVYNLGEVVKYKNVAYKFNFDNENIQNFGSNTGITYGYLDKVEYGGFIFASKINDNIAEPLIPVNIDTYGATSGRYTQQDLIDSKYWDFIGGLSGHTGTLPARYNFKHDYAYDYHVLKIQPIRVEFANGIWQWGYNPLNINYEGTTQQQYSNLSSVKGIAPPLPEPLTLWDYLPDGSSGMSGYVGVYNDNTSYNGGDIVDYPVDFKGTTLQFKAYGWGFGTSQINEDGDDVEILPYSPQLTLSNGTLLRNEYNRYSYSFKTTGNDKDNYEGLKYENGKWIIDYGTPKWGNGLLFDPWHLSGFATNLRKTFADTIELTYNKLVHNLNVLDSRNITFPTSLNNLIKTNFTGITKTSVVNSILSELGVGELGVPGNIFDVITTTSEEGTTTKLPLRASQNGVYEKLQNQFLDTQMYYYSRLLKHIYEYQQVIKMLNGNLNVVKTKWKDINLSLINELYEGFYLNDRYYPDFDGVPLLTKDLELNPTPSLGNVYIKPGDNATSIKNLNSVLSSVSNDGINNNLFTLKTSFDYSGVTSYQLNTNYISSVTGTTQYTYPLETDGNSGFGVYYDKTTGEEKGPTASNTFYLSDIFSGVSGGLIPVQQLSPSYTFLKAQYDQLLEDIAYYTGIVSNYIGQSKLIYMRDRNYIDKGSAIVNQDLYEKQCAIHDGTDMPIFIPILTINDFDTLSLRFGDFANPTPWFNMPGGTLGMPNVSFSDLGSGNNTGFAEPYKTLGLYPNRYQFKDVENTFNLIYSSSPSTIIGTTFQSLLHTSNFTNRKLLENGNSNPRTGMLNLTNRNQLIPWDASGTVLNSFGSTQVLYQPYGAINTNDNRADNIGQKGTQDLTEDRASGYGSQSAYRIYGNMAYNKPSLIAIEDSQLFATQGKHSITHKERYKSILPYAFHAQQCAEIKPKYTKVTDVSIWKEIQIERRRQKSEAEKKKFTAIFSIIFPVLGAILSIVDTVVSAYKNGGGGADGIANVFTSAETWGGVFKVVQIMGGHAAITGIILSIGEMAGEKRAMSKFLYNPTGTTVDPPVTPRDLLARCQAFYEFLQTQTVEDPDITPTEEFNRVTYAEYKWSKEYMKYFSNTVLPDIQKNYNPYYIDYIQNNVETAYRTGIINETKRTQLYLDGLTGTSQYTSLTTYTENYENNALGVTIPTSNFYTPGDLQSIADFISICNQKISLYESSLFFPRSIRTISPDRPAIIKIKNVQYGPSKTDDNNPDVFTSTTTYPTNPTPQNTQLYADFEIVDAGEGFYKDDGLGNSVGIYKTYSNLNISITDGKTDISLQFISIISGYCNDGNPTSIFGIKSIDTTMQKDRVKIPLTYTGGAIEDAINQLEGKTFNITSAMMDITDRAFAGGGGATIITTGNKAGQLLKNQQASGRLAGIASRYVDALNGTASHGLQSAVTTAKPPVAPTPVVAPTPPPGPLKPILSNLDDLIPDPPPPPPQPILTVTELKAKPPPKPPSIRIRFIGIRFFRFPIGRIFILVRSTVKAIGTALSGISKLLGPVGMVVGPAIQIYETVETIKEILATPPLQQTC